MINRSVEGNYPHIDDVEFEKIDLVLDVAETAMLSVASEHNLRETKFQRWRWDQPEIVMSWVPFRHFPTAGKNIRVLVKPDSPDAFTCTFESNAWFDERQSLESFVRYWDHFPAGTIPHVDPKSVSNGEGRFIREYVQKAYEAVSDLRETRLSHAIFISSNGDTHEFDGSAVISEDMIRGRSNGTP